MTESENILIWVAVKGTDVEASTNLKGLGKQIGAKYPTLKSKSINGKLDTFYISVKKDNEYSVWLVKRVELTKIARRKKKVPPTNGMWFGNGFLGYK